MSIHPLRGMAAGLLAGCAAAWVMNEFQQMRPRSAQASAGPAGDGRKAGESSENELRGSHQSDDLDEDATVKTAQRISQQVFKHELTTAEKQIAGPVVHYAYGSLVGALYGGQAEFVPTVSAGLGMPFGFALWLLGDEIGAPALGLAKNPLEYPAEVHADALAAHFMYGAATDVFRRILRHLL